MKTKICSKCKIEKSIIEFHKNKYSQDKLRSDCILCRIIESEQYYQKNKNRLLQQTKEYYRTHKEEYKKSIRKYRLINKEKIIKQVKKYQQNHKIEIVEYQKIYKNINHDKLLENAKKRRNNRRKIDMHFKIMCNLRKRIWDALKFNYKSASTLKLLGCSLEFFKSYYESKFTKGMSLAKVMNGEIHCDHIRPCASFDLSKPEEQRRCFHYTNLQPLWAKENLSKGAKCLN